MRFCFLMDRFRAGLVMVAVAVSTSIAGLTADFEPKPADEYFSRFQPLKAPAPASLILSAGDRLAICGDSITEQRM